MMNTNGWNRFRYTLIFPLYNIVVRPFQKDRQRAIELLNVQSGEKVLILGCGPGLDLDFLRQDIDLTAIDITPAMVAQTLSKAYQQRRKITAQVMDGQALTFPDTSFDVVILNLILAVIPDPYACIQEANRVLKPGGRAVIFDKFLPADQKPNLLRRALNVITNTAFSDINRQLEPLLATVPFTIEQDEPAQTWKRLNYRITLVRKRD